jgi:hypothetical protein
MQRGSGSEPPQSGVDSIPLRVSGLAALVASNARCHLILQKQFSLLETLLFDFVVDRNLLLLRQLGQSRFAGVVFFEPMSEFLVLTAENPLNVIGLIRHP